MIQFSIFDPTTGLISQSGYCPNEQCLPPLPQGYEIKIGIAGDPERQRFDGDHLVEYVPLPTRERLVEAVILERGRRLAAGFEYDFGDTRGTHRIGTSAEDRLGWDDVSDLASAMIDTGDLLGLISIVTDTGPVTVTATEWKQILLAAAAFRQPIWAASFALQAMSTIPETIADDQWWPG